MRAAHFKVCRFRFLNFHKSFNHSYCFEKKIHNDSQKIFVKPCSEQLNALFFTHNFFRLLLNIFCPASNLMSTALVIICRRLSGHPRMSPEPLCCCPLPGGSRRTGPSTTTTSPSLPSPSAEVNIARVMESDPVKTKGPDKEIPYHL